MSDEKVDLECPSSVPYFVWGQDEERWLKFDQPSLKDRILRVLTTLFASAGLASLLLHFLAGLRQRPSPTSADGLIYWGVGFSLIGLVTFLLSRALDDHVMIDAQEKNIYVVNYGLLGKRVKKWGTFEQIHTLGMHTWFRYRSKKMTWFDPTPFYAIWHTGLLLITTDGKTLFFYSKPDRWGEDQAGRLTTRRADSQHFYSFFGRELALEDSFQTGEALAKRCGFRFKSTPLNHFLKVRYSHGDGVTLDLVKHRMWHFLWPTLRALAIPVLIGSFVGAWFVLSLVARLLP